MVCTSLSCAYVNPHVHPVSSTQREKWEGLIEILSRETTATTAETLEVEGSVRVFTKRAWAKKSEREAHSILSKHNVLLVGPSPEKHLPIVQEWDPSQIGAVVDIDQQLFVNGSFVSTLQKRRLTDFNPLV